MEYRYSLSFITNLIIRVTVGRISRMKILKVIPVKCGNAVCLYPKSNVYSRNIFREECHVEFNNLGELDGDTSMGMLK